LVTSSASLTCIEGSIEGTARASSVSDACEQTRSATYVADHHLHAATDATGQVTNFGYDANNNLTSVQLPTGARSTLAYADSTHPYYPTSSTDAQGNTTSVTYDANGNVTTITIQLPSQNQTQLFYNSNGTLNHVIDARGNTTSYGYDAGNKNLTSVTPPAPLGATTIGRDALSRTSSVTDGKGQQRTYTYDALDRVTALTYPAYTAGNVSTVLDADGNTTRMTDSTGTTSYTYDALNRQTRKTLPGNGYYAVRGHVKVSMCGQQKYPPRRSEVAVVVRIGKARGVNPSKANQETTHHEIDEGSYGYCACVCRTWQLSCDSRGVRDDAPDGETGVGTPGAAACAGGAWSTGAKAGAEYGGGDGRDCRAGAGDRWTDQRQAPVAGGQNRRV